MRALLAWERGGEVEVVIRPVISGMPGGTTLRVEILAERRGTELRAEVTAEAERVHVRVWEDGVEALERPFVAPRRTDVDLLAQAIEAGGRDLVANGATSMAAALAGPDARAARMTQIPDRAPGPAPDSPGEPEVLVGATPAAAAALAAERLVVAIDAGGRPARPGRHRDDRRLHVPRALPGPARHGPFATAIPGIGCTSGSATTASCRGATRRRTSSPWTASCSPATPPRGWSPRRWPRRTSTRSPWTRRSPPAATRRMRPPCTRPSCARVLPADAAGRPVFDAIIVGIGPDGHLLSVFPGSAAFDAPGWVVPIPAPTHVQPHLARVSLTPGALDATRTLLPLAFGGGKAAIVAAVLGGPRDERRLPAQRARRAGATWILDAAAAGSLSRD